MQAGAKRGGDRNLWAGLAAAVLLWAGGCTAPMPVRATGYDLRINLDPKSNTLRGQAAVRMNRLETPPPHSGTVVVDFELNAALHVSAVDCDAAMIRQHTTETKRIEDPEHHEGPIPIVHHITLDRSVNPFTLTVNYEGRLEQDPSAGERRGEIHNFAMSAHVGTNGVYLSDSGGWYPAASLPETTPPENALADYRLVLDRVPGMEFVASLEPAADVAEDGALCWTSSRPLSGIALTGGRRVRLTVPHAGVRMHALVSPGKEAIGRDLLECARQCYDRYVPLLGPYPFGEFTILESFFSSGFAFPGFTQLTPVILNEKKPYWRHGYLDHEFLHNWFGNGIYVDPHDGNWCEALASYAANLSGYELDGDAEGARRHRRNTCHFLSRQKPEKDKPVGTFGLKDGADRAVGYDKGCMVFHMLAFTMGPDNFWASLRRLAVERMGQFTNWRDLQACFEAQTRRDLSPFFEQWVRRPGAPQLAVASAVYDDTAKALELDISQGGTDFVVDVPIRIWWDEQNRQDIVVSVASDRQMVRWPAAGAPAFVELDPDYHVFRKVPPDQIVPTSNLTRYGKKLVIVQPDGDLWAHYALVASDFEEGNKAENTRRVTTAQLTPDDLEGTGVLVLRSAVRHPLVEGLLALAECPVSWTEGGFRIGTEMYDQPGQAVLVTMRRPDDPTRGITVYYGNDERALSNAGILGYYSNSLLVFGTGGGAPAGMGHGGMGMSGGTEVLYREDLETRVRVPVLRK